MNNSAHSTTVVCPISGETPEEERVNTLTHLIGLLLSIVGSIVLISYSYLYGSQLCLIACSVYSTTLVLLYAASTFYHRSENLRVKRLLRIADHATIYLLIAGCYTPFTLGPLRNGCGWTLFGIEWGIACVGVIFKLFATHRFQLVSTLAYLAMGWMVVFSFSELMEKVPLSTMYWMVAGGLAYSAGTLFFLRESLPFNHAIWHLFVLVGGVCHYCAIFGMVLYLPHVW